MSLIAKRRKESGDGSGIVVVVGEKGPTLMTFWEGGPSNERPVVTSLSAGIAQVALTFPDYPEQKSAGTFECRGKKLLFRSADLGQNETLSRITSKQAADLTAD